MQCQPMRDGSTCRFSAIFYSAKDSDHPSGSSAFEFHLRHPFLSLLIISERLHFLMLPKACEIWGAFPPEVYLIILDQLAYRDDTCRNALAILNLALCGKSMYGLVDEWARHNVKFLLHILEHSQDSGIRTWRDRSLGVQSPVAILCKRISWLCTLCNLRATGEEVFTELGLCTCCDTEYFPKLHRSELRRLNAGTPLALRDHAVISNYRFQRIGDFVLAGNSSNLISCWCGPFFRWSDINEFAEKGYLNRRPGVTTSVASQAVCTGRVNGCFNHHFNREDWPADQWQQELRWYEARRNWMSKHLQSQRERMNPLTVDLVLLRSFRYQFDPRWSPMETEEQEISEYMDFAQHWAVDELLWKERPWGIRKFPICPEMHITVNSNGSGSVAPEMRQAFDDYRLRCRRIRALLKVFP